MLRMLARVIIVVLPYSVPPLYMKSIEVDSTFTYQYG